MYDRFPSIQAGSEEECLHGWSSIATAIEGLVRQNSTVCIECYPGAFEEEIERSLSSALHSAKLIHTKDFFRSHADIETLASELLTDDPVFGRMNSLMLAEFFDAQKIRDLRDQLSQHDGSVVLLGVGASLLIEKPDILIYADLARWEIQKRQRSHRIANLGAENYTASAAAKYKRAFFMDWRAADRLKAELFERIDLLLDTNIPNSPNALHGTTYRKALATAVHRPFRLVPFFDPGPWGGHWMERVCNLPVDGAPNHAWCFDCVPEENSLLLAFGSKQVEVPAINLVLAHPHELMGEDIYQRFGAEFPIRFDLLDTMEGGNLSLQIHPLTSYIQEHFGMQYTQDESYYMLDAGEDAGVYLGLRDGISPKEMASDLEKAQAGNFDFPAEKYVNLFPAKKHDHFLIPAGTVHCSGKNSMVLEISATPYIFTFKLWDWGRLGLDGNPRPIHLRHGLENIQWDRTTDWVRKSLINHNEPISQGEGWSIERTGLHELEFIDSFRCWFSTVTEHDTQGTVHVLNLVEGEEAIVESPTNAFAPFVVHYAESFVIPAAVGRYTLRPHGASSQKKCAVIRASVRP
jgi:mannose-6-phosphate isomerase class I